MLALEKINVQCGYQPCDEAGKVKQVARFSSLQPGILIRNTNMVCGWCGFDLVVLV